MGFFQLPEAQAGIAQAKVAKIILLRISYCRLTSSTTNSRANSCTSRATYCWSIVRRSFGSFHLYPPLHSTPFHNQETVHQRRISVYLVTGISVMWSCAGTVRRRDESSPIFSGVFQLFPKNPLDLWVFQLITGFLPDFACSCLRLCH